jgi:hypothetical protein
LLADVLSTAAHRVRVPKQQKPDRMPNPKGRMMALFKQYGRTYVDVQYARRIADSLDDLTRLMRCSTFRCFAAGITGKVF